MTLSTECSNQNNNCESFAAQTGPGCLVPACYRLFDCFCVTANLNYSGAEGRASHCTVHCPGSVTSNPVNCACVCTLNTVGPIVTVDADRINVNVHVLFPSFIVSLSAVQI